MPLFKDIWVFEFFFFEKFKIFESFLCNFKIYVYTDYGQIVKFLNSLIYKNVPKFCNFSSNETNIRVNK